MKKQKLVIIKAIILFISIFIFTGCNWIKPLEVKKVNDFKVEDKKGGGARLVTNITLNNPNSFGYTINSVDIDVYIEQVLVGKLMSPNKLKVDPNHNFTGDFFIDVGFPKLLLLGTTVLPKLKKGAVEVHLTGTANASIWFITKNFNLDKVGKVKFK